MFALPLRLASLFLISLASALPQVNEDEWLAVINGKSPAPAAPAVSEDTRPRKDDGDYNQFQDNRRAPPVPIQTGIPNNRRVGVAPPPPPQVQQQRQPLPPPSQGQQQRQPLLPQPPRGQPQRRQPQAPGQPLRAQPPVPGQPLRGPPPPALRRPQPPPTPKPAGILDTVVNGVNSVLNPVVGGVGCAATNLIADEKLKDENFIRSQMDCAMSRGPCDEVGKKIKFLAPEVLAGRCPAPCNPCIKDQIRKVMSQLSQKYPREFQQMMASLTRRG